MPLPEPFRLPLPREPFLSPTSFSNQIWVRKVAHNRKRALGPGNSTGLGNLHRVGGLASIYGTCTVSEDLHRVRRLPTGKDWIGLVDLHRVRGHAQC